MTNTEFHAVIMDRTRQALCEIVGIERVKLWEQGKPIIRRSKQGKRQVWQEPVLVQTEEPHQIKLPECKLPGCDREARPDGYCGRHYRFAEGYRPKHSKAHTKPNKPRWKTLDYGAEFTSELKASIRQRDQHRCQRCGSTKSLAIHHIDYDRRNNSTVNLITLCGNCHFVTVPVQRHDYWRLVYKELQRFRRL